MLDQLRFIMPPSIHRHHSTPQPLYSAAEFIGNRVMCVLQYLGFCLMKHGKVTAFASANFP